MTSDPNPADGPSDSSDAPDEDENGEEFELTDQQATVVESDVAAGQNVAITAGAGTGKTTTLTERYVHLLEETDATPEEIVTITFTEDAANELRERIRGAVDERLSEASEEAEGFDRWRRVKDRLADGYVHTIHGFCARLLREHAAEAPIPPGFEVYDEADAQLLANEVVHDEVGDRLAEGDDDVVRLARLWDRETLESVLAGLLTDRPRSEVWADRWVEATPEDYYSFLWDTFDLVPAEQVEAWLADPAVEAALETADRLRSTDVVEGIEESDYGVDTFVAVAELIDRYEPRSSTATTRDKQWFVDALCDELTSGSGSVYSSSQEWRNVGKADRWKEAGFESEQSAWTDVVRTFVEVFDPESFEVGAQRDRTTAHYKLALARVFDDVLGTYGEAKERSNVLDYDDLVETAVRFLADDPDVRRRRREQFRYVMVDEVQDTDPRQWDLVELLTSESTEGFDGENVLLVGDEKQSIYRFRGADVTSFAGARRQLAAANDDDVETNKPLTGNFRTTEETLEFGNEFFQRLFDPLYDDGYEPYEAEPQDLDPERRNGTDVRGEIEYLLVPDVDEVSLHGSGYLDRAPPFADPGDREAHALAARLTRLFADPPTVYDEDDGEYRPARPDDVTILLRSRGRLEAYERALDRREIPYTVASGTGFYESTEITAVLNLLRVLEDPSDERALYGVLRSPLFGIPDEDLFRVRAGSGAEDEDLWTAISRLDGGGEDGEHAGSTPRAEWHEALADARECIARWRRLAGTDSDLSPDTATRWGTLLTRIIDETGYIASLAGDERPRQAAVNVERLREQLRSWEQAGVKTTGELVDRIETRRELEAHSAEATIPEDTDGVEIRTIHSAKGLEFEIVVVPEMGTKFNFGSTIDDYRRAYFEELNLNVETASRKRDTDRGGGPRSPDRTPVLALQGPTEVAPYTTEDTFLRERTKERMKARDRAELKRLLYVAVTRARDHLILSGEHGIETADGDYSLDSPKSPPDASRWRDWIQPILLEDDDGERDDARTGNVLSELASDESVARTLGDSHYTVTLPRTPIEDWADETSADTSAPAFDVNVPTVPHQSRGRIVTATNYADAVGSSHDELGAEADANLADESGSERLSPGTVGDVVHRICERRPTRDRWRPYAEAVARREGETASDRGLKRIETYAERCIEFVDETEAERTVIESHDELPVVARFDGTRLVGEIDHLTVTPDTFRVVDYKTNGLEDRRVEDLADYYFHQMRAYAVALHQNDPDRDVSTTLFFTDGPTPVTREWTADELSKLEETVQATLE